MATTITSTNSGRGTMVGGKDLDLAPYSSFQEHATLET
jgi:hypothetical protein